MAEKSTLLLFRLGLSSSSVSEHEDEEEEEVAWVSKVQMLSMRAESLTNSVSSLTSEEAFAALDISALSESTVESSYM